MITADTVRYLASYIDHSAAIVHDSLLFSPSTSNQKLLVVPLFTDDEINPRSTIRITVGMEMSGDESTGYNHDPRVGIADGAHSNAFELSDGGHCSLYKGEKHHTGPINLPPYKNVTFHYELIFTPFYRYGTCSSTTESGGYLSSGTFYNQLDLAKGLNFVVFGDGSSDLYRFYYILIETLQ